MQSFLDAMCKTVLEFGFSLWLEVTADRTFGEFGTFLELSFFVNGLLFAWPGMTEKYRNNLKEQLSNYIQGPISDVLEGGSHTDGQKGNHTSKKIIEAAKTFLKRFEDRVQTAMRRGRIFAIVMMIFVGAMLFLLRQEFDIGFIMRLLFLLAMIGPGGYLIGSTRRAFSSFQRRCDEQFGYLGDGEGELDPLESRKRLDAAIEKRGRPKVRKTS